MEHEKHARKNGGNMSFCLDIRDRERSVIHVDVAFVQPSLANTGKLLTAFLSHRISSLYV
jgi:hypothetical protein